MEHLMVGRAKLNATLPSEPLQVVFLTAVATVLLRTLSQIISKASINNISRAVYRLIRKLPSVKNKLNSEKNKLTEQLRKSTRHYPNEIIRKCLPELGVPMHILLKETELISKLNIPHSTGRISGAVYHGGEDYTHFLNEVNEQFYWSNPLHTDVCHGIKKMEAEVVSMCCNLFSGPHCCGVMTSGGTESIVLTVKTYRDRALDSGIRHPEIIIPNTAHPAFDKAGNYFGVRVIRIAVDCKTLKVNMTKVKQAISRNTILIVGSAPNFPYGTVDDIASLAALALRHGIGMHVDCCLGGFLVPFMQEAGFSIQPFDFSVPGVTSISCDTHKYGCAPKGSSVIMYHSQEMRRWHYFTSSNWPGGLYGTTTVAGSRPGCLIASTWAALVHHGQDGYVANTKRILEVARKIAQGIQSIKGLKLMGEPQLSVIAWTSETFDIMALRHLMKERDWHLIPLQFPSAVHFCITNLHASIPGFADQFLGDLRQCTQECLSNPNLVPAEAIAMYGSSQLIPDRAIVDFFVGLFFDWWLDVCD